MRPALAEHVNNELEAVFFIDRVFHKDILLYDKCISGLKEYKEFFPSVERITSENIASPGEWTKDQVFLKFSGHDIPNRRNTLKRIKDNFKSAWFEYAVYPHQPENTSGITKFKKEHLDAFSRKTLCFSPAQKDLVLRYAYFSLSSTSDILWINAGGAASETEFKKAVASWINNGKRIDPLCELTEFYSKIFYTGAAIIIIENAPYLGVKENLNRIFTEFTAAPLPPHFQLIVLEAEPGTEDKKADSLQKAARLKSYTALYIAAFLFLALISIIAYNFLPAEQYQPVLVLKYFSDEVQQDRFLEGMLLTWTDKKGNVLHTETNNYSNRHKLESIPEGANNLLLSKGSYEIFPDSIPVKNLRTDSLRIVFYKSIRIPDISTDTIVGMNAQRWYSFVMSDTINIRLICEALSESLSPQIAVFADRFGKERIMPNDNILGNKKTVEVTGTLPPGKYYIKVRGYDKTTGPFRLTAR